MSAIEFSIQEKVHQIAQRLCQEMNLELVDLHLRRQGQQTSIEILADQPTGGITLAECAQLNQSINSLLETENVFHGPYLLEVSSPGLDRPLKTKKDFLRVLHREVRIFLEEPIDGKWEYAGQIDQVDDEGIVIENQEGRVSIPLAKMNRAKQHITREKGLYG